MADDARTEARRRIAEVLHDHRRIAAHCACGARAHLHRWHQADAVLELFPDAAWHGLLNVSTGVRSRRLVLHGSSEPVTKESPDA